jgi:pantetheine-phosphate adenylyltransferase
MTLIYPGSFDPVTLGHIDIAIRGAKIADRLIVAVLENTNKSSLFSTTERVAFLQSALKHVSNIEIDSFSGLLAEYARQKSAAAILRGLRSPADYENEARYSVYNNMLSAGNSIETNSGIETIFLTASPSLSYISSSIVREAAFYISTNIEESALRNMVTAEVLKALQQYKSSITP